MNNSMLFLILLIYIFGCKHVEEEKLESMGQAMRFDLVEDDSIFDSSDTIAFELDKSKWIAKDGKDYPHRDEMLEGLLNSHILDTLMQEEVLALLGQPDRSDGQYLFYMIAQQRLSVWPLHTKTMVVKSKEDGIVDWVRIHE